MSKIKEKPTLYSYIIPHDGGSAPNPYHGICSLVICKSVIRRTAKKNDWVVGLGAKKNHWRCFRNFRHIVRKKTRDIVRMICTLNNLRQIEIITPAELL